MTRARDTSCSSQSKMAFSGSLRYQYFRRFSKKAGGMIFLFLKLNARSRIIARLKIEQSKMGYITGPPFLKVTIMSQDSWASEMLAPHRNKDVPSTTTFFTIRSNIRVKVPPAIAELLA